MQASTRIKAVQESKDFDKFLFGLQGSGLSASSLKRTDAVMKVQCPNCGKQVVVDGLGRKRLNIDVKNICDALCDGSTVTETAKKWGCSRGYIYKVLKACGMLRRRSKNIKSKTSKALT